MRERGLQGKWPDVRLAAICCRVKNVSVRIRPDVLQDEINKKYRSGINEANFSLSVVNQPSRLLKRLKIENARCFCYFQIDATTIGFAR
jgi:hypothetical protein